MSNEFDYSKVRHVTSVDQSDRNVPYNLRQSGPTKVEMLISTRVRKSPYWHLSMKAFIDKCQYGDFLTLVEISISTFVGPLCLKL